MVCDTRPANGLYENKSDYKRTYKKSPNVSVAWVCSD